LVSIFGFPSPSFSLILILRLTQPLFFLLLDGSPPLETFFEPVGGVPLGFFFFLTITRSLTRRVFFLRLLRPGHHYSPPFVRSVTPLFADYVFIHSWFVPPPLSVFPPSLVLSFQWATDEGAFSGVPLFAGFFLPFMKFYFPFVSNLYYPWSSTE